MSDVLVASVRASYECGSEMADCTPLAVTVLALAAAEMSHCVAEWGYWTLVLESHGDSSVTGSLAAVTELYDVA